MSIGSPINEKILGLILPFMKEAGGIALNRMGHSNPRLKGDRSVITETDHTISKLAGKYLSPFLKSKDHILIDEENPELLKYFDQRLLKNTPYIWSLDPIDGTRLYANQIPLFAISLGLLKELKPWIGAVYFPALKELFYCDGKNAYFVNQAFSSKARKIMIKPIHQDITSLSILLCDDEIFKEYSWDYKNCQIMISASATVDLLWPTIGRGCGTIFKSSLWDLAGSWPIVEKAGFKLRSITTGKLLESLDLKRFESTPKPWRVKDFYIVSSENNFHMIKEKFPHRASQKQLIV